VSESCVAVSWSGGKDSCLAGYRAMKQGYTVAMLLNFVSRDSQRCCFHGIPQSLMRLQAQALGIPIVTHPMPDNMQKYEEEFKNAVSGINGISGMVFGDIYLDEHKEWVERVCGAMGISCIEPLWNEPAAAIVEEFIDVGFTAVVVSCKADLFGPEFVGRVVDRAMLAGLLDRGICPCGENGEFHTIVVDGPFFKERIELTNTNTVLVDGFWKHWFLDIREYRAATKTGAMHENA
jgi:diphthine-ammonia ligase